MDHFFVTVDQAQIKKERNKARDLRKSPWWKQQLSKGICYYCEESFSANELSMDHIVPVARGGKSSKGNVVPACKDCNSKKGYHTPAELVLQNIDNTEEI
ncbi:MAG: HNH endonuclease [Bdellovibrionota bacterium]|nr:HNH endonuclease [Pseudobdellovibrionaceae bacterium]|tara:strand:+ start:14192 stop:14491 length:300 start_codon:yes stop_codon:yes gene_type:complete